MIDYLRAATIFIFFFFSCQDFIYALLFFFFCYYLILCLLLPPACFFSRRLIFFCRHASQHTPFDYLRRIVTIDAIRHDGVIFFSPPRMMKRLEPP